MARQYTPDELNRILHDAQRDATKPAPPTIAHVQVYALKCVLGGVGVGLALGGALLALHAPADVALDAALKAAALVTGGALAVNAVPTDKIGFLRRVQTVQRFVFEAEFKKREAYRAIERLEAEHADELKRLEKALLALRTQNNSLRAENNSLRGLLNPQSATHVSAEPGDPEMREHAAFILQRWFGTLRQNERGETVGDWFSRRDAERANWSQGDHAAAVGLLKRAGIVTPRGNFYRVAAEYPDLPSALHRLDTYHADKTSERPLPTPSRFTYVEPDDD